jgi:hypothetical protein
MLVSHHGHRESFEEVVEGWHPAERAGCLTYILDDVPRTFRDDIRKYIYCSYCPDGKGRVDCCEVLWPCGQTGRLRGLAAGFDIRGGNGDNQEGTQRRHHENESTAAGHSQAFGDTAVSVRGWVVWPCRVFQNQ